MATWAQSSSGPEPSLQGLVCPTWLLGVGPGGRRGLGPAHWGIKSELIISLIIGGAPDGGAPGCRSTRRRRGRDSSPTGQVTCTSAQRQGTDPAETRAGTDSRFPRLQRGPANLLVHPPTGRLHGLPTPQPWAGWAVLVTKLLFLFDFLPRPSWWQAEDRPMLGTAKLTK